MKDNLKGKTINGLMWSFVGNFSTQGVQFVVGIVLARMLSPQEFGLIGMLAVFIAISQAFIDSGFSTALIRKKECISLDYSTVFFFNLLFSVILYLTLYFGASLISNFFNEPQLTILLRILGIGLIINAFSIVQGTILTKQINFKLQTRISVISAIVSGIVGVAMAYNGYGIWSLVTKTLVSYLITTVLLWLWNGWRPTFIFSLESFKELFSFGSKIFISVLIDTIYRNIYYIIIGKYFSASQLGYYTRADQFSALPSQNITTVIHNVTFPVLASIQNDMPRLKSSYRKLIKSTMLITFMLMLGMSAVSESLIISLIGEKWEPSVIYLQLVCFVGMFYPLHALNLNMLQVQGRSDLFLRLEVIKKIIAVPTILLGIFLGVKVLIISMIGLSIISYYLNSYWSGKIIGYSFIQQIKDIAPAFALAVFVNSIVYLESYFLEISSFKLLFVQVLSGLFLAITTLEIIKFSDYLYIRNTIFLKFKLVFIKK